jgi:hypothetical protein
MANFSDVGFRRWNRAWVTRSSLLSGDAVKFSLIELIVAGALIAIAPRGVIVGIELIDIIGAILLATPALWLSMTVFDWVRRRRAQRTLTWHSQLSAVRWRAI